jgi:hypothetical protein
MLSSRTLNTSLLNTAVDHNTVINKQCALENQSGTNYVAIIFVQWRFQKVGHFITPNAARNPFVSVFTLSLINAKKQNYSWRASGRLVAQEIPRHVYCPEVLYHATTATKPKFYTKLRNVLIFVYDQDCWILSHTPNWKVVHRWPPMTAHSTTLGDVMLWSHGTHFVSLRRPSSTLLSTIYIAFFFFLVA